MEILSKWDQETNTHHYSNILQNRLQPKSNKKRSRRSPSSDQRNNPLRRHYNSKPMPSNLSELNLIKKKEPIRVGIKPQINPNTVIVNLVPNFHQWTGHQNKNK